MNAGLREVLFARHSPCFGSELNGGDSSALKINRRMRCSHVAVDYQTTSSIECVDVSLEVTPPQEALSLLCRIEVVAPPSSALNAAL